MRACQKNFKKMLKHMIYLKLMAGANNVENPDLVVYLKDARACQKNYEKNRKNT